MDPLKPEGEFHHYQIVDPEGNIPFSISVLVHFNNKSANKKANLQALNHDDVISFHRELESFNGNFEQAFKQNSSK